MVDKRQNRPSNEWTLLKITYCDKLGPVLLKTLRRQAYYEICPFAIHYESVCFIVQGPQSTSVERAVQRLPKSTSGLYYKQVMIIIYNRNDIGLYYKARDNRN